jgi:hypothetical protein
MGIHRRPDAKKFVAVLRFIQINPCIKFPGEIVNGNKQILPRESLSFAFKQREALGIEMNEFSRIDIIVELGFLFPLSREKNPCFLARSKIFCLSWKIRRIFMHKRGYERPLVVIPNLADLSISYNKKSIVKTFQD